MNTETNAADVSPLVRPRLTDLVRSYLVDQILNKSLNVGDELPSEGELANRLRVSKSVVREAVKELSALDLIETRQGKPSAIKGMSSQPLAFLFEFSSRTNERGFRDLIELRRAIECHAASLAADRHDQSDLERMRTAIQGLRKYVTDTDLAVKADWEFHVALVNASGNDLFKCVFGSLEKSVSEMQCLMRVGRTVDELETAIDFHVDVVDAVEAGDADRARRCMEKHFRVGAEELAIRAEQAQEALGRT